MFTIFPVSNYIFIALIAGITVYSTFLTTKGGLTDNRFTKTYWNRLTTRGKRVLCLAVMIIILLSLQELNSKSIADKKEDNLKREISKKDSLIQNQSALRDSSITNGIKKGVDLNRQRLFDDISKAFSKQELRLDTVKKNVERIRDSAKNVTNNYSQIDPVLVIAENGIKIKEKLKNSIGYSIVFASRDAGSTNFKIKGYLLVMYSDGDTTKSKIDIFPKNLKISANSYWTTGFRTITSDLATNIFLYVEGTFTTLDGTKSYNIEDVYQFTSKTNEVIMPLNKHRLNIMNCFRRIPETQYSDY